MKNLAASFALLFGFSASALALGCDSTKCKLRIKHEAGLVLYANNFNYFPGTAESSTGLKAIENYFFSGLQHKIVFNRKHALRTSFQHTEYVTNYEIGPEYGWFNKENSFTKNHELRIGYERIFCCGKVKPFVFADLFYSYGETRGYREWYGCFSGYAGNFAAYENTQGAVAGAGVKYFLRRNVFLSIETSLSAKFVQLHTVYRDQNPYKSEFFDLDFNPVKALSVGLRF